MKPLIAYLLLICSSVLAYNDSLVYSFYSLKNMVAPNEYRRNDFSAVFGDTVFEQNGLFIFYERLGIQRLYVRSDENREREWYVYQLPETHMLPWLHPEKYMEKRSQLLKENFFVEKCKTQIPSDELLLADLDSLHIDMHLYVEPGKSYNRNLDYIVMGYSQKNGKRRYFYYVRYDDFWEKKEKRFAVYANVFKIMENIDEKIAFPECR